MSDVEGRWPSSIRRWVLVLAWVGLVAGCDDSFALREGETLVEVTDVSACDVGNGVPRIHWRLQAPEECVVFQISRPFASEDDGRFHLWWESMPYAPHEVRSIDGDCWGWRYPMEGTAAVVNRGEVWVDWDGVPPTVANGALGVATARAAYLFSFDRATAAAVGGCPLLEP